MKKRGTHSKTLKMGRSGRLIPSHSRRTFTRWNAVRTHGSSIDRGEGKFKVLLRFGAKGTVEEDNIYSMGPVVTCLDNKMRALQLTKKRVFPPPPQAPFWAGLALDW